MSTTIDSLRGLKQVQNLHYCEIQIEAPHCYWIFVRRYLENSGDSMFEHHIDMGYILI